MRSPSLDLARLVRFGLAGGLNTLVTYGVYLGLILLGLHYNLALALEYAVGILLGFLLNRAWTFGDRARLARPFPRYLATYGAVFGLNLVLLDALVALGAHPLPGQALALAAATLASYLLQKHWVFRSRTAPTPPRTGPARSEASAVLETAAAARER